MKILFPVVEYQPIAGVGKLGTDVENLVKHLSESGQEISVCLPFYNNLFVSNYKIEFVSNKTLYISGLAVSFWKTSINNITVYLIKNDEFFSFRQNIYGYDDDVYRFTFFSLAVIELIKILDDKPEIIHIHDWHTAIIPLLLEINNIDIKTVLTVHNVRYQGMGDLNLLNFASVDYNYFSSGTIEFYNSVNLLKSGLFFSNKVLTNSKFYLKDIQDSFIDSYGLNGVLKLIESKSQGISFGVEESYNPKIDNIIVSNYDLSDISGKFECKTQLQKDLDLPVHSEIPLIVIPSQYISDTEVWLLNRIMPYLVRMEVQIVILGNKLADFEKNVREVAFRLNCIVVSVEENEQNLRKVFSGADIFLDISLKSYNDHLIKIALKYGVIPIVFNESPDLEIEENKFRIFNFTAEDLINTIKYTINRYYHLEKWNEKVRKCMTYDFSWQKTIKEYTNMYKDSLIT